MAEKRKQGKPKKKKIGYYLTSYSSGRSSKQHRLLPLCTITTQQDPIVDSTTELVIGHKEISLIWTKKLPPCLLADIVLEVTVEDAHGEKTSTVSPHSRSCMLQYLPGRQGFHGITVSGWIWSFSIKSYLMPGAAESSWLGRS